ncbi:hypothetical protein Tco_0833419, partial [Tanacetum coccineum]
MCSCACREKEGFWVRHREANLDIACHHKKPLSQKVTDLRSKLKSGTVNLENKRHKISMIKRAKLVMSRSCCQLATTFNNGKFAATRPVEVAPVISERKSDCQKKNGHCLLAWHGDNTLSKGGLPVAKHGKRVQISVTLKEDASGNEVAHLSQPFMSQNKIGRSSTKGIEKVIPAHELLMINKHVAELLNAMLAGVVLCKPQPPGNPLTMHPSRSHGHAILLTTGAPERTTGSGRHLYESHRLQRVGSKGPPSEYKFLGNCKHVHLQNTKDVDVLKFKNHNQIASDRFYRALYSKFLLPSALNTYN